MKSLLRTRVDRFKLEDSLKLSQLEALMQEGRLEEELLSVDQVFENCPAVFMKPEADKLVYNGNPFADGQIKELPEVEEKELEERVRVYDSQGRFIGLYRRELRDKEGCFRPVKCFCKRKRYENYRRNDRNTASGTDGCYTWKI